MKARRRSIKKYGFTVMLLAVVGLLTYAAVSINQRAQQKTVRPTAIGDEVWVDEAWSALSNGTVVSVPGGGNATIGTDAFATVQEGVNAVNTN